MLDQGGQNINVGAEESIDLGVLSWDTGFNILVRVSGANSLLEKLKSQNCQERKWRRKLKSLRMSCVDLGVPDKPGPPSGKDTAQLWGMHSLGPASAAECCLTWGHSLPALPGQPGFHDSAWTFQPNTGHSHNNKCSKTHQGSQNFVSSGSDFFLCPIQLLSFSLINSCAPNSIKHLFLEDRKSVV